MTAPANAVEIPAPLVNELRHARAQIAKWQEIADAYRSTIEQLMGQHDTATVDGQPVVHWTHVKSTRLDQSLLKSLHPEVFAECQSATTSRRFALADGAS